MPGAFEILTIDKRKGTITAMKNFLRNVANKVLDFLHFSQAYFAVAVGAIGIGAAIYLGWYIMFIGGIMAFINAIKADPTVASDVAWAIARVVFASVSFAITAGLSVLLGKVLYPKKKYRIKNIPRPALWPKVPVPSDFQGADLNWFKK